MMNLAVAEAVYIRPALSPPLWYEMGSFWYLIRLGLSALGTRYGTRRYEISPAAIGPPRKAQEMYSRRIYCHAPINS